MGRRTRVWLAMVQDGCPGKPIPVSDSAYNAYDPAVAVGADGNVYVAYTAFTGGNYRPFLQVLGPDGERRGEPQRLSNQPAVCVYPSVAPATGGGVWFSYTSFSAGDGETPAGITFVRHHRYRAQKDVFAARGVVYAGKYVDGRLWSASAPRSLQGFGPGMRVGGSEGASRSHVFEDAEGRLRLLLRQYRVLETPEFKETLPRPLQRCGRPKVENGPQNHPDTCLMTLADDNWLAPEPIIARAHVEAPISHAVQGNELRLAFTEDGRGTGWNRDGEWFDGEGELGVGLARVSLDSTGPPAYDWRPFRLAPTPGPAIENPLPPPSSGSLQTVFGQTHAHTNLSICCREMDRDGHFNYRFMQDVQHCRFGMTTDHAYNMWHTEMLLVRKYADYYYFPGEFVAAPAYEWTGSSRGTCDHDGGPFGHVNPVFLEEDGELEFYTPCDPACAGSSTPKLWLAHEGQRVVTPPHHVADQAHPYNWAYLDTRFASMVEVFQDMRGSGESSMAPGGTNWLRVEEGNWIVDQLLAGKRFGFIASADHTGLALAGALVHGLTREALYEAFTARCCFGTTGAATAVAFTCNDQQMGQALQTDEASFVLEVAAAETIAEIHVVRQGETHESITVEAAEARHEWRATRVVDGEFWYCRVILANGEMAWTSPIWLDA